MPLLLFGIGQKQFWGAKTMFLPALTKQKTFFTKLLQSKTMFLG